MNEEILKLYKSIVDSQQDVTHLSTPTTSSQSSQQHEHQQKQQVVDDTKLTRLKEQFQQQLVQINHNRTQSIVNLKRHNTAVELSAAELLAKKRREKCSKGLRHFSMKVCEKVKTKSTTTYNEVADELVNEYCDKTNGLDQINEYWSYDQKNVRRRVYDALNVLMAMNIISKEKKEIKWIGLPCNKKQEMRELQEEKHMKLERLKQKSEHLKELILEQIGMKTLIERNRAKTSDESNDNKMYLPFLIVTTDKKTVIECNMSTNKKEYSINFDNKFEILSHMDILKRLSMTRGLEDGSCSTHSDLEQACNMVPKLFEPYVRQMAKSNEISPIITSTSLPNFKNFGRAQLFKCEKHPLELSDNDYSAGDSEQSDSENESLGDSSS